ncbi:MAG: sigma-54-dependent Fis family transcriptional regulator, partial [Desulfobulbaceae bacterium]
MAKILIVDDEQSMRDFLKILLIKDDYEVATARDGEQALDMLSGEPFDLVITDIRMPGMSGLDLLQRIKEMAVELPVIMITAFASPNDAVHAIKKGAFDYISKPFNVEEIKSVIFSALKNEQSIDTDMLKDLFPNIIGESREMVKIFDMIKRIAPTPANVLIYGESGTGKELVAQAIHARSLVKNNPFIPITCSAIPEDLMESELFGH